MEKKEIEEFVLWLTILGYSDQRIKQYPRSVIKMLGYIKKEIRQLKKNDLSMYLEKLKTKQPPMKPTYINSELSGIRTFGKFLLQTYSYHLPTGHLQYCRIEQREPNIVTVEEVKKLYNITDNSKYGYRDRVMLSVCYGAGLRRNEAISLHVKDIDTKHGNIHVRSGKNYTERLVPIPKKVVNDIKKYIKEARPMFLKGHHHQRELFLGYRGRSITAQVYEKRIKVLARMTGDDVLISKNITLHLLRHSIATHLMQSGVPLEQVSKFLGHTSLASTQVYTHIKYNNDENQKIPNLFTG